MEDVPSGLVRVQRGRPKLPKNSTKLKKQLSKLDRDIQQLRIRLNELTYFYDSKLSNRSKILQKIEKLDIRRYEIRMKLKGYQ